MTAGMNDRETPIPFTSGVLSLRWPQHELFMCDRLRHSRHGLYEHRNTPTYRNGVK